MKIIKLLILLSPVFMLSCSKSGDDPQPPVLRTTDVSDIANTTAVSRGTISSDGGSTVTARGVVWSATENPTTADSKTTDGSGAGSFTSDIIGLTANTTYYLRSYATNGAGTAYGNQLSFTTTNIPTPGTTREFTVDNYRRIDMGIDNPAGECAERGRKWGVEFDKDDYAKKYTVEWLDFTWNGQSQAGGISNIGTDCGGYIFNGVYNGNTYTNWYDAGNITGQPGCGATAVTHVSDTRLFVARAGEGGPGTCNTPPSTSTAKAKVTVHY